MLPCHKVPEAALQTKEPGTFPVRAHDADTGTEWYIEFSDVTVSWPIGAFTVTFVDAVA